jgi:hypothetical protein
VGGGGGGRYWLLVTSYFSLLTIYIQYIGRSIFQK